MKIQAFDLLILMFTATIGSLEDGTGNPRHLTPGFNFYNILYVSLVVCGENILNWLWGIFSRNLKVSPVEHIITV